MLNWRGHPLTSQLVRFRSLGMESIDFIVGISPMNRLVSDLWLQRRELHQTSRNDDAYPHVKALRLTNMMPLGLHHIFKFDHHIMALSPMVSSPLVIRWNGARVLSQGRCQWHRLRPLIQGTDAVGQYPEPYRSFMTTSIHALRNISFGFHHVPWSYKLSSGSTLWQELCMRYNMGVAMVETYRDFWHTSTKKYMKGHETEWQMSDSLLNVQLENAKEWRDTCLNTSRRSLKCQ